ncbi:hypothetical protein EIP91_000603 [Steccherinum ochraceum]|uniref:AB hydrolase-1 domain-containing protein n=1 Tax=Steccherinum ochraceum TaxID=92696 RepID=A0A4R0RFP7_9APHY|nr:hypothetical protein EIP91_000603 [Steccherinum ochraceum]
MFPRSKVFGLGFSLGANIIAKYVGEEGTQCPLHGVVVLANPWDFKRGSEHIEKGSFANRNGYRYVMGGALQTLYKLHRKVFLSSAPGSFSITHNDLQSALKHKKVSLKQFDELVTAPIFGYRTATHYYTEISSSKVVDDISVPLLALNARDDPMVADLTLPIAQVRKNPHIVLAVTPGGGHMGWFEQRQDGTIGRWYPKPVKEFFSALLESDLPTRPQVELAASDDGWQRQQGRKDVAFREFETDTLDLVSSGSAPLNPTATLQITAIPSSPLAAPIFDNKSPMTGVTFLFYSPSNPRHQISRLDLSTSHKNLDDIKANIASHLKIVMNQEVSESSMCFHVPDPPVLIKDRTGRFMGYPDPSTVAKKCDGSKPVTDLPMLGDEYFLHILVTVQANAKEMISLPDVVPRVDTVEHLYNQALQKRFVLVTGCARSGKTTLRTLLHNHILQLDSNATVLFVNSWKGHGSTQGVSHPAGGAHPFKGWSVTELLQLRGEQHRSRWLLFDDAEATYNDQYLWNINFKDLTFLRHVYVVCFASYTQPLWRSPAGEATSHGTAWDVTPEQVMPLYCMSARIRSTLSHCLAFSDKDCDAYIDLILPSGVQPDMRRFMHKISQGYVGVLWCLLEMITSMKLRSVSLEAFMRHYPPRKFADVVSVSARLGRSILPPEDGAYADRHVMQILELLAINGHVAVPIYWNCAAPEEVLRAGDLITERGWAYRPCDGGPDKDIVLILPSPLHRFHLSWTLHKLRSGGSETADVFGTSLHEFWTTVLSRFSYPALRGEKDEERYFKKDTCLPVDRMTPYHREFFHAAIGLCASSTLSIALSPEYVFASSEPKDSPCSRCDFVVPEMKWGIGISQDGEGLSSVTELGHPRRMSSDPEDFVMLDFRSALPERARRDTRPIYYIVIDQKQERMTLYDSTLRLFDSRNCRKR